MSTPAITNGLVVVRVHDQLNRTLAGHDGNQYISPPQPREQAMALVRLLLGHEAEERHERDRWTAAIAGGTRVVTLAQEPIR